VPDIEEVAVPAYVGCPRLEPDFTICRSAGVNSQIGVYRIQSYPAAPRLRGASDDDRIYPGVNADAGSRGTASSFMPTRPDRMRALIRFPYMWSSRRT
jgi:hypothetical protein